MAYLLVGYLENMARQALVDEITAKTGDTSVNSENIISYLNTYNQPGDVNIVNTGSNIVNAWEHAYVSAYFYNLTSSQDASYSLGIVKEIIAFPQLFTIDTLHDLYNDLAGIDIAKNSSSLEGIRSSLFESMFNITSDGRLEENTLNPPVVIDPTMDERYKSPVVLQEIINIIIRNNPINNSVTRLLFSRGMQGFETTCSNQVIDYTSRPDTSLQSVSSEGLTIIPSIAAEPQISGSNALLSLQPAMAADTTGELQNLVDSYKNTVSNNQTLDFSNRTVTVDNIIKKWTGSDTIEAGSAGEYVDAQKLNAVEKFMAERFVNHNDILGEGADRFLLVA